VRHDPPQLGVPERSSQTIDLGPPRITDDHDHGEATLRHPCSLPPRGPGHSLGAITPRLRTDRLLLREWRDDDLAPYAALNADPVVMEHFPAPLTRGESDAHVTEIERRFDLGEPSLWALEVVETSEFIGFTGLLAPSFEASFTPCVEVGWRLAGHAWGQGYATEAARAAVTFGFAEHDLDEILSFTTTTNLPSQRVMRRLGMTHDPADDFDHPNVDRDSVLRRHVLFRLARSNWTER